MGIENEDAEFHVIPSADQCLSVENAEPVDTQNQVLRDEVAVLHDRWMRAEAEIANVRNRAKRDVEEAKQYAANNMRRGLDSIPPAKGSEPEIITRLREGFVGLERSFIDMLKRNGIEREDPKGTPFDTDRHQAVSEHVSSGHAPGIVLSAATAAWTLHGRLLRPAMVVVTKR